MKYFDTDWYYIKEMADLPEKITITADLSDIYNQKLNEFIDEQNKVNDEDAQELFNNKIKQRKLELLKILPFKTLRKIENLDSLALGYVSKKDYQMLLKLSKKYQTLIDKIRNDYYNNVTQVFDTSKINDNLITEVSTEDQNITLTLNNSYEDKHLKVENYQIENLFNINIVNATILASEVYLNDEGYDIRLLLKNEREVSNIAIKGKTISMS